MPTERKSNICIILVYAGYVKMNLINTEILKCWYYCNLLLFVSLKSHLFIDEGDKISSDQVIWLDKRHSMCWQYNRTGTLNYKYHFAYCIIKRRQYDKMAQKRQNILCAKCSHDADLKKNTENINRHTFTLYLSTCLALKDAL